MLLAFNVNDRYDAVVIFWLEAMFLQEKVEARTATRSILLRRNAFCDSRRRSRTVIATIDICRNILPAA